MTATADEWRAILPDSWSGSALDAFLGVVDERPDLAGADLSSLEQAAALISAADRLDEAAREAGMISTGSTGQTVVHPAVSEARLARTSAAAILSRLALPTSGAKTNSQRGRDAARERYRK